MGELKKLLLNGLWKHRFVDDSMAKDKFEEAIVSDIHSVVNEANAEFPCENDNLCPKNCKYCSLPLTWKKKWLGK